MSAYILSGRYHQSKQTSSAHQVSREGTYLYCLRILTLKSFFGHLFQIESDVTSDEAHSEREKITFPF